MSFDDRFPPQVLTEILQLPEEFAALRFRYPRAISLLAAYQEEDEYPFDFIPKSFYFYYEDTDTTEDPYLIIENKEIDWVEFQRCNPLQNIKLICCDYPLFDRETGEELIDSSLAYLEIEGKVLFNRLHEHQLPPEVALPGETLAKAMGRYLAQNKTSEIR